MGPEGQYTPFSGSLLQRVKTRIAAEIWAPELSKPEKDILERWKLRKVEKAENPVTCDQVVIQLNALYTTPELIPSNVSKEIAAELKKHSGNYCPKTADYDHPVQIFSSEKEHELIFCLKELDRDIAFEKSIGCFTPDARLPVVVSISVTHENLDSTAQLWVRRCIQKSRFHHLKVLLLSEGTVNLIKRDLLKRPFEVFSVQGKYASHFNALKYVQLLLEKAYGSGFGIDNEGLRRFVPFTLSCVGRAEDQEFYFYGLSKGLRGIFHPDLRIAHYKTLFSSAESKTAVQRFVGDMYRLVLFSHLAELLGVKEDIDPMPGIFAGGLAFCQAFFNMVYRTYVYSLQGQQENANHLIIHGMNEIEGLYRSIQKGEIQKKLAEEEQQWKEFAALSGKITLNAARRFFDGLFIEQ